MSAKSSFSGDVFGLSKLANSPISLIVDELDKLGFWGFSRGGVGGDIVATDARRKNYT